MYEVIRSQSICKGKGEQLMNEQLNVEYLQGSVTVSRVMNQIELAALLLEEDIFLLSVNCKKAVHLRRNKNKAVNCRGKQENPIYDDYMRSGR